MSKINNSLKKIIDTVVSIDDNSWITKTLEG